ncbi:hypothetical protein [Sphingobacterium sp. LRF_L2]|uniref:hypothetical protein n=1 Tax=Sphingobacterium sp. LRF_L2 TaxID=3369421 RepID=UPI003F6408D5
MRITNIQINDTAVHNENSLPNITLNLDVNIVYEGDTKEFESASGIDTTTLKDSVTKRLVQKLTNLNLAEEK